MSYKVAIRRTGDKLTRVIEREGDWGELEEWIWTEGNYGCDCNRHIFFHEALPALHDVSEDCPCGDGVYYEVLYVELPDGRHLSI